MTSTPMTQDATAATAPTAASAECVLRIVAGLHAGASRTLAGQEMILVGSGDDCDIVLADAGVASHHALISLVGGRFSLRALDAPLHVGTSLVHPGDPIELDRVQRVGLGPDAALAFGRRGDVGWAAWVADADAGDAAATQPRSATPYLRRLPAVAAVAALSLASLAIFAAVMPAQQPEVDPTARLQALVAEYAIDDAATTRDVNGAPVLSGTIRDAQSREAVRERLASEGIEATLELRTGDDIAADVSEVLRSQGLTAKTRYVGNGDVEIGGRFEDEPRLRTAVHSRAMRDVKGINRVLVPAVAKAEADAGATPAAAAAAPVRIIAIVRGEAPHLKSQDGREFAVGAEVPGRGRLISITENSAHALMPDGQLQRIEIERAAPAGAATATVATDAAATDAGADNAAKTTAGGDASRFAGVVSSATPRRQ